jgi:hypothetical protein
MDPLLEQARDEHARIVKFQRLWRSKRVFTNSQGPLKFSPSALTAKIVTFKLPVNFKRVFESAPKGFSEIMGYKNDFKKPVARWVAGQGWLGETDDVKKIVAKRGQQTIVFTDTYFDVMGLGNYEEALLAIVKNNWAPKMLLHAPPTYKKIDGIFYINRQAHLEELKDAFRQIPGAEVTYKGDIALPTTVLKLSKPKWTYQFFKNGTVLFTGIKDPSEREAPKQLIKQIFAEIETPAFVLFNVAKSPAIKKPAKGGTINAKMAKLANRYNLAKSWNMKPPHGYYVRPGTNGKPRLYPWIVFETRGGAAYGGYGNGGDVVSTKVPIRAMNLKAVAPKVLQAFRNAGHPIPAATAKVFANAGHPLVEPEENKPKETALKNRRAPGWDATKPGFYVRPGPGKQPYWFKIPEGLASGRKTVIKTYTEAGRNIPAAVREIFKIGANVKTGNAGGAQHVITMGLNKILRINNRQATRLTKAELLAVARNMGIPEANSKMTPATLMGLIQNKAGVHKPVRNANVLVNGIYYRFLNNGRVEKTTTEGVRTQRAWNTIPTDEQNKIAKKVLPAEFHTEYNATSRANKFLTLRAFVQGKRAPSSPQQKQAPSPAPRKPSSVSSTSSNNNFALEAEYAVRIANNLKNLYKNGNESNFLKILKALPKGARGKPLKATVNKAYAKFIKEAKGLRSNESSRARYVARINVPNWMPAGKVNAYKKLVTNLAFRKPKPKVANIRAAVRAWINREVPLSPARAARTVENAITGEIKHIPAYVPKPRKTPPIPKRSPPKKAAQRQSPNAVDPMLLNYALPANRTGLTNLVNALTNMGLATGPNNTYTWAGLERRGLNKKFKKVWEQKVVKRT